MQLTMLGQSGLRVPVFAVGTAPLAQVAMPHGVDILRRAYELGARWWDTSDDYGTHPLLARLLGMFPREELVISTKINAKTRTEGQEALRNALFTLGTDYLDILFLHNVTGADDFAARQGTLEVLQEAKAAGTVKAIGLSSHGNEGIMAAAECEAIDVVMAPWNIYGDLPDGSSQLYMEKTIRACYQAGKGVVLMKVLAFGTLRPVLDTAIHGAANFRYKHTLVIGVQSIRELETDIRLTLGQPVDASILAQLKSGSLWGKAA